MLGGRYFVRPCVLALSYLFLGANIMIVNRIKCVLSTLHYIFVVYSSIEPQQNVLN